MKRQSVPELLDTDSGAPAEIAGALADLRFINRSFGGITTTEEMINKNEPKQESNQATLARYKKEMDGPRMAESTRKKNVNQTTRLELEKLP